MVTTVTIILTTSIILNIFFDKEAVSQYIQSIVTGQTGGQVTFEWKKFSYLNGFEISNLKFYLPETEKSFDNGGSLQQKPIITFTNFRLSYDLLSLFNFRFMINEALLINPHINLNLDDKLSQFEGLMNYRSNKFPEEAQETKKKSSNIIPYWLPPVLNKLYSPISFEIGPIGIKNASMGIIKKKNSIDISGLHLYSVFKLDGSENEFKMDILSRSSDMSVNLNKNIKYSIQSDLEIVISNIKNILVQGKIILKEKDHKKLVIDTNIDAKIHDDYLGLSLKQLKISSENLFNLDATGYIQSPKNDNRIFDISLEKSFKVSLDKGNNDFLKKIFKTEATGKISNRCVIIGTIKMAIAESSYPTADCRTRIKKSKHKSDEYI